MSNKPFAENPYQSPTIAADPVRGIDSGISPADVDKLRRFRQQIHALGAIWILLGALALGSSIFLLVPHFAVVKGIMLVLGVVYLAIGIMTCRKEMWAVHLGILVSYASVVLNLVNLNLCALAILAVILVQAHRVAAWAKDFNQRGILLTTKV